MGRRYVAIWFRYLKTDWFTRRDPSLKNKVFVISASEHGRMVINASSYLAEKKDIYPGMTLADARAIHPDLEVKEDVPGISEILVKKLAEWCIRYSPWVTTESSSGLIIDASGCAHLWKGELPYLTDMVTRFEKFGYSVRIGMADTIGAAWAASRYGADKISLIEKYQHPKQLLTYPATALRIDVEIVERLEKLGLHYIGDFIGMPRTALLRRFGKALIQRIDQAFGNEEEIIEPHLPVEPYVERLPCFEPIITRTGIEIALKKLLSLICDKLKAEEKGLRICLLKSYLTDGKIITVNIGTNRPSANQEHLFKLFENKIGSINPDPGIDLFLLEAPKVEDISPMQEKLWELDSGKESHAFLELMDRFMGKFGNDRIQRFLPDEHYWPERSYRTALSFEENTQTTWKSDRPRPIQLLAQPEPIEVTAPIPDYPPMLFRYKGKLHIIKKADGPERIEQEWWIQEGQHRDYYSVEDEEGHRYWLFRSGHYDAQKTYGWFIHGFFA